MTSNSRRSGRVFPCRKTDARGRSQAGVVMSTMSYVRRHEHTACSNVVSHSVSLRRTTSTPPGVHPPHFSGMFGKPSLTGDIR